MPGQLQLLKQPVDPEATGKIRHIVRSAHKWGGDGRKPVFRKIRRVLMSRHPEVVAKAFGGKPDVAAAWIKNNWYRMRGQDPPPTRGRKAKERHLKATAIEPDVDWYLDVDELQAEDGLTLAKGGFELFIALDNVREEDGLIWTPICRTGRWAVNPIRGQKGPLHISLEKLQTWASAFEAGAWEFVQVPLIHSDTNVLVNTGFVKAVKVTEDPEKPGQHLLWGGLEITEPDVKGRILRGTIAGVSVNVIPDVKHQETGEVFPEVLTHVCLTNVPFINGLGAFKKKLAAAKTQEEADEAREDVPTSYELLPEGDQDFDALLSLAQGDETWDEHESYEWIREQIHRQLNPRNVYESPSIYYCVLGVAEGRALVREERPNDPIDPWSMDQAFVADYEIVDGAVQVDPPEEWTKVKKTWIELTRDFQAFGPLELARKKQLKCPKCGHTIKYKDGGGRGRKGLKASLEGDCEGCGEEIGLYEDEKPIPAPPKAVPLPGTVTLTRKRAKGGDKVPEDLNEGGQEEGGQGNGEVDETITLSRTEFDTRLRTALETALTEERTRTQQERERYDAQLTADRQRIHQMEIDAKVTALDSKLEHAPALLSLAKSIMIADVEQKPVLKLTRTTGEGEEAKTEELELTPTGIVEAMLAVVPASALTATKPDVPDGSDATPDPEDNIDAKVDAVWKDLKEGPSVRPAMPV